MSWADYAYGWFIEHFLQIALGIIVVYFAYSAFMGLNDYLDERDPTVRTEQRDELDPFMNDPNEFPPYGGR